MVPIIYFFILFLLFIVLFLFYLFIWNRTNKIFICLCTCVGTSEEFYRCRLIEIYDHYKKRRKAYNNLYWLSWDTLRSNPHYNTIICVFNIFCFYFKNSLSPYFFSFVFFKTLFFVLLYINSTVCCSHTFFKNLTLF